MYHLEEAVCVYQCRCVTHPEHNALALSYRGRLMVTSFWISFAAWLLYIYAALALSDNAQAAALPIAA